MLSRWRVTLSQQSAFGVIWNPTWWCSHSSVRFVKRTSLHSIPFLWFQGCNSTEIAYCTVLFSYVFLLVIQQIGRFWCEYQKRTLVNALGWYVHEAFIHLSPALKSILCISFYFYHGDETTTGGSIILVWTWYPIQECFVAYTCDNMVLSCIFFSPLSGANEDSDERPNYCTGCTEDSAERPNCCTVYWR